MVMHFTMQTIASTSFGGLLYLLQIIWAPSRCHDATRRNSISLVILINISELLLNPTSVKLQNMTQPNGNLFDGVCNNLVSLQNTWSPIVVMKSVSYPIISMGWLLIHWKAAFPLNWLLADMRQFNMYRRTTRSQVARRLAIMPSPPDHICQLLLLVK